MLQPSTLSFLKALKKNNNKAWFDKNRKTYEAAKADYTSFVQAVINEFGKKNPAYSSLLAKNCLFRINRDVRFSKDKSPYKTNMGAYFNPGGKKSILGGFYFHCEPGQAFVGGGLWMPMPAELAKIRQEIDYNYVHFKKILANKKFKAVYGDISRSAEYTLTRLPKGYEADNPAGEYLKLKSYVALASLNDTDLTSKDLVKKTVAAFRALQPMIQFINHALAE